MHIIKSVGVLSIAKIMGMIYGCMGLIFAPFFLLVGLMGSALGSGIVPWPESLALVLQFSCRCFTVRWDLSWERSAFCSITCLPDGWAVLNWRSGCASKL